MRAASATIVVLCSSLAMGNVFDMADGLTSLETVTVGNAGNAPDTRYPDTTYGVSSFGAIGYTYNIGKYEVTVGQYTEFLNAVAKTDTYGLYNTRMADTAVDSYGCNLKRFGASGSYTYSVDSEWANHPVNYVGWGDAARFTNWLHNGQPTGSQNSATTEDGAYSLNGATSIADLMAVTRDAHAKWAIPSEDEWYKAAYHRNNGVTGDYWDYPTGTNLPPGQDMTETTNLGNNANYGSGGYGSFTNVGAFSESDSPYGTFDQGGNVFEWNEAIRGPDRCLRGGSFLYDVSSLHAANRGSYTLTYEESIIGFRVVQVPEPTSLLLLALGGLAVMRRR